MGVALPLAGALALTLVLAACDTGPSEPRDAARLSIFLTDAPGDVEAVWIQIDRLSMIGANNGEIELPGDFEGLIEVTELVDRALQIVREAPLEAGAFRQLRLVLGSAVLLTVNGDVYATPGATLPEGLPEGPVGQLHCPSCSQSGFRIVLRGPAGEIEEGEHATLVLDFDVAQSFGRQAGQSGRWIMRPVLHVTRVQGPGLQGSSIRGTVALAADGEGVPTVEIPQCPAGTDRSLADFVPNATADNLEDEANDPVVRTGSVNPENGVFSINFVEPDSYVMGFADVLQLDNGHRLEWAATVTPANVTVAEGADVEGVVYTVTGATCVSGG